MVSLFGEYTLEECGAILLSIMFYDKTGGTQPIPKKLAEVIEKDSATRALFQSYMEKTAATSKGRVNKHKRKKTCQKLKSKQSKGHPLQKADVLKSQYL